MSAQEFLTQAEQQQIRDCVTEVEKTTSGEIVPLIASASSDYPRAQGSGALVLGLAVSIPTCMVLGREDMWTALVALLAAYSLAYVALAMLPCLRRIFVQKREMADEVEEGAMTSFYIHGLNNTRDKTGILIYVSVYEKQVQILADTGINEKVDSGTWDAVVSELSRGIKEGNKADAICHAIKRCGELVTEKFPIKHDDTNELPNLIID